MPVSTLNIEQSALALLDGNVVAIATEAVWGLSCDPFNPSAVQKLLSLKSRPPEKGLILVASQLEQIENLLSPSLQKPEKQTLLIEEKQPISWLVPCSDLVPDWVTGQNDFMAIRITRHPVLKSLCESIGGPLISTSANPAGCQPAREIFQLKRYFGEELLICKGRVGPSRQPSQIRNLLTGQVIRE